MNTNQKEFHIKNLVSEYSIETTPNIYKKYGGLKEFLNSANEVYITYLPNEKEENVVQTSKKIIDEGLVAIPHLPARTIENIEKLEKFIGKLSEYAGCKKILVIGGGGKQKGEISSSLEVLQSELLSKYNFSYVGVAGHPEGSPDISEKDLDYAIVQKNKIAKDSDYKMYLATQFFFEAKSLELWEKKLFLLNNKLDIHAGIPGPATLKTLLSYAKSCGIGNSIKFLSKQTLNITKLASTRNPDKLISELADYKKNNVDTKLKKLHLYAFGGMEKTSRWMNDVINKPIEINTNNGFKVVD